MTRNNNNGGSIEVETIRIPASWYLDVKIEIYSINNDDSDSNANNTNYNGKENTNIISTVIPPLLQPNKPDIRVNTALRDFIVMSAHDLIQEPSKEQRRRSLTSNKRSSQILVNRPLPGLVDFINTILQSAGINKYIALTALVYLERAKASLPKNSVGNPDTRHRMFLASILVASKALHGTEWQSELKEESANRRMSAICNGYFTLSEINDAELAFLKLIDFRCFLDDTDMNDFISKHRADFPI